MKWLEKLIRQERKHRRELNRKNINAYRKRKAVSGHHRMDITLSSEDFEQLRREMTPKESYSNAISRLINTISGKHKTA